MWWHHRLSGIRRETKPPIQIIRLRWRPRQGAMASGKDVVLHCVAAASWMHASRARKDDYGFVCDGEF
ncbi:hypothetical protein E3N88_35040 [Mikania micrantha]|uniref:Uncharacterized protein n=1 Tax=Mikania micrantha TaxID=192012 RepID=A0A5N6LZV3_9ASTR|nr:hypothetical protein E3N88_35040 [Mikania micrantha]